MRLHGRPHVPKDQDLTPSSRIRAGKGRKEDRNLGDPKTKRCSTHAALVVLY